MDFYVQEFANHYSGCDYINEENDEDSYDEVEITNEDQKVDSQPPSNSKRQQPQGLVLTVGQNLMEYPPERESSKTAAKRRKDTSHMDKDQPSIAQAFGSVPNHPKKTSRKSQGAGKES